MRIRILYFAILLTTLPLHAAALPCITPEATASTINKEVCVRAHVYNVVQLRSGTRFLDVCSPQTPNSACHFAIISLAIDARDVGPLTPLIGADIEIRGTVRDFTDHREIVLSHVRQLHGGREKFRPSAALLSRFSAEDRSLAFRDPNARSGSSSAFKPMPLAAH